MAKVSGERETTTTVEKICQNTKVILLSHLKNQDRECNRAVMTQQLQLDILL
jgi:hypothetical protein